MRTDNERFKVGAGHAWRPTGNDGEVDSFRRDDHVGDVVLEDRLATFHVRQRDVDVPVESSRTGQGRVQGLWEICGCHNDHLKEGGGIRRSTRNGICRGKADRLRWD